MYLVHVFHLNIYFWIFDTTLILRLWLGIAPCIFIKKCRHTDCRQLSRNLFVSRIGWLRSNIASVQCLMTSFDCKLKDNQVIVIGCITWYVTVRNKVDRPTCSVVWCCRHRNIERTVTWRRKDGFYWKTGNSSHSGPHRSVCIFSKFKKSGMGNRVDQSLWRTSAVRQGECMFCVLVFQQISVWYVCWFCYLYHIYCCFVLRNFRFAE